MYYFLLNADNILAIENSMNYLLKKLATFLCATTFFTFIFGSFYLYAKFTPVTYVIVDTDSSVELALNRFGNVIVHRVYHKTDGKALAFLKFDGMPVSTAVSNIVTVANSNNAFDKNASIGVFISVAAGNKKYAEIIADRLSIYVNNTLSTYGTSCRCYATVCPDMFLAVGHVKDISPGRLCMISLSDTTSNDPPYAVYERLLSLSSRRLMSRVADELEKARYGAVFFTENVPV